MPNELANRGMFDRGNQVLPQLLIMEDVSAYWFPVGTQVASIEAKTFCGCQSWSRYTVLPPKSSPATGGIRCGKTVGF
jgi:hypothetical protein